ncbi:ubiquitinyl hydrolase 1 [Malassezia cuniculi]|uniref:ubiquitinyl hydrolase 1 n=1 Tax=Malassezia cuniculi TaxID=948313 RepID=A0AAF0J5Z8_9BASI|nr:ubiquitinyl hydrolase 1 [Malassezia cuniculi]
MAELYDKAHECTQAPLLAPRGLVNLGNFCFANVILQMLAHTPAFYMFVTQLSTMVPQDLSNSTPLLESMIRFLGEFHEEGDRITDNDAFVPDYVYEAMRLHRRFDVMQIGHQEDAEEFFGLVLSTLHEEVQQVLERMKARQEIVARRLGRTHGRHVSEGDVPDVHFDTDALIVERPASPDEDAWLEVGQKGRTSLARSAKTSDSPLTRMFDGRLRSVLSVPGSKSSIMLEPYRSLPVDITHHHVVTIEDALAQITTTETISDVWAPALGKYAEATKQVFIEMLPPVLVLHLKRFVYDEVGGVQKSCKPIRYGATLQVPQEALSAPLRRTEAKPSYRLYGVVYHHGNLASGGHYTVDLLRQDNSGWLHIDDTQVPSIRLY